MCCQNAISTIQRKSKKEEEEEEREWFAWILFLLFLFTENFLVMDHYVTWPSEYNLWMYE